MLQVTHSPFLQALGYAIINSLWQFALLWLIYVLLNTIQKLPSQQKYLTGLLLQVSGFIWFIVTFTFYFSQYSHPLEIFLPFHKSYPVFIAQNNAVTGRKNFLSWIMQAENFLPYVSVAYLFLLVFFSFKWIRAYNFTRSIRTKGLIKIEDNWRLFVKQLSEQLGINREVKIYLSDIVQSPLTIGFFKPLILIPLASLNHLNSDQMEAVILHELAHIKRFDYLCNLFLALIETTLFFNPFMVLISRHIKRERENCCDDRVLQYNYNAASYAGALLQIATCQSSYSLFALKAADNKQVLLNRIKRMIEKKEKTIFNYRYQLIAFFVMLIALSSLAILASRRQVNTTAPSSSIKEVMAEPMIPQVSNPSFYSVSLASVPEKKNVYKEPNSEKKLKKNVRSGSLSLKKVSNNNDLINRQQNKSALISSPAEIDQVAFTDNFDLFTEDLAKDINISNPGFEEGISSAAALKNNEIALAEEKLKKLTIHLLAEKKTLLNQKKVFEEIKAAFEQLQAVKIQLGLKDRQKEIAVRNLKEFEKMNVPQFSPAIRHLKITTKRMQKVMQEAREKFSKSSKSDLSRLRLYNYNIILPQAINPTLFEEKLHNFSYEFSEKPKAKVVLTNSLNVHKKVKKIVVIEVDNDELKAENTFPALPEVPGPKVNLNQNLYIIRI